jgi:predicted secreted protein
MRFVIVALMLLASCAGSAPSTAGGEHSSLAAPTPAGVARVVNESDDGQNVTIRVGQTIAVELVGVPTAGYLWTPVETPPFVEAAGEYGGPTSTAQLEEGFAGGSHWEAFLFKANAAGEGALRFEQRRPWEDGEPPVDEFSIYLFAEE